MNSTAENPFRRMLAFLDRLDEAKAWYRLEHVRDSIMVVVTIPGERWEIEFFEDGAVEVERFRSSGEIDDVGALDALNELVGYGDGVSEAATDPEPQSGPQVSGHLAEAHVAAPT